MRRFVAVCIALAPAGCTLLSGVSDLELVASSDAGPATAARIDGSAAESSVLPQPTEADADADAGLTSEPDTGAPDVLVPAPAFCKTQPATVDLCYDFDSQSIPQDAIQSQMGCTLGVDSPGHDSTNALHAVGRDATSIQCEFGAAVAANPTKVRWGFDVRIDEGTYAEYDTLGFNYGSASCSLQPTFSGGTLYMNEWCPNTGLPNGEAGHTITAAEAAGGWYTYVIELDFATRTFKGSIKKPSGATVDFGPLAINEYFVTAATVTLHPGLGYAGAATPATKLRTDNIWLAAQ